MVAAFGTPRTFVKFCLTGLSGVVVNLGIIYLMPPILTSNFLANTTQKYRISTLNYVYLGYEIAHGITH